MIAKLLRNPWVISILVLVFVIGTIRFIGYRYSAAILESVQARYPLDSQYADLKIDKQSVYLDTTNTFGRYDNVIIGLHGYRIPYFGLKPGQRLVIVGHDCDCVAHLYFSEEGTLFHIEIALS